MVRPSKSFLYDFLESQLKFVVTGVGLDASSANFKNRRFFKTALYVGLDINQEALLEGIRRSKDANSYGLLADLNDLDKLPTGSCQAVVSTNTLYILSKQERIIAVRNLCRVLSPEGLLILEMPNDETLDDCLVEAKKYIADPLVLFYKNPLSRLYENIFEKDGYLGNHPIAGQKIFRIFAWLLSRLEFTTFKFRGINRFAIIVSKGKKKNPITNGFSMGLFKNQGNNLYSLD